MNRQFDDRVDSIYKKFNMLLGNAVERFVELEKLATEIHKVSGYSLEKLLELFLAGYTLKPPISGYTALYTVIDEMVGDEYEQV